MLVGMLEFKWGRYVWQEKLSCEASSYTTVDEGVTTLTFEVANDVPAGDEKVVRGDDDEWSYDKVSRGGRAALLG